MKQYGLIGYPLGHSLSAEMHNFAFKTLNIEAQYSRIELLPTELKQLPLYFENLSGVNVTIPYKENIITLLDELDESAQRVGAVNTIIKKDQRLIGYNTDSYGFLQGLYHANQADKIHSKILIIGAGGAAKAVVAALFYQGAEDITLINRQFARQQDFSHYPITFKLFEEINSLAEYDLIVQTTPIGTVGYTQDYPIDLTTISSTACCYDLVYNPLITPFLQQAQRQGATIINGLSMLVYQGAKAFELWTGQSMPTDTVITILENKLKEK